MNAQTPLSPGERVAGLLNEFHFPVHRIGYRQLCIAIAKFAEDDMQCLSKIVYPHVAKVLACPDWRSVEHSIRDVIMDTWEHGDRSVWEAYFPGYIKPPSNKCFIATLAARLR